MQCDNETVCITDCISERAWARAPESKCTRKVGSSFWKRPSDLEKFVSSARFLGRTASESTASGTYMVVIDRRRVPSVKVAPEEERRGQHRAKLRTWGQEAKQTYADCGWTNRKIQKQAGFEWVHLRPGRMREMDQVNTLRGPGLAAAASQNTPYPTRNRRQTWQ